MANLKQQTKLQPTLERTVVDIATLHPSEYNPRVISKEAAEGLAHSIKSFGLVQEIVVNRRGGRNRIVGGHQRVEVLKQMGEKKAAVVFVDLDDKAERALNVVLNNEHIAGEWNTDALVSLLDQIKSDGAVDFSALRLDELLSQLGQGLKQGQTDPDDAPPLPKKAVTKLGDLYIMGEHRLLCADASKPESYVRLLGNDRVDLVFTDPPYGIDIGKKNRFLNSFQPSGRSLKDMANDIIGKDALFDLLRSAFTLTCERMRDDASCYVTAPQGGELGLMMMMMMSGLPTRHVLIWNKNSQNFSLGRLDYEYKHEPILYTWKKTHRFFGKGQFTNSVWDIDKPRKADVHPTMKPVLLVHNAIFNSSLPGDLVLDPFCGSGTTLMAADQTGRKARVMEIDPAYCDVIVKRWSEFSAKKAVLEKV